MSKNGNGISEFVLDPKEINDKVIFLLGESMKHLLKNFEIDFEKNLIKEIIIIINTMKKINYLF